MRRGMGRARGYTATADCLYNATGPWTIQVCTPLKEYYCDVDLAKNMLWRKHFSREMMPPSYVTLYPVGGRGAHSDDPGQVAGNMRLSRFGDPTAAGAKPPGASEFSE